MPALPRQPARAAWLIRPRCLAHPPALRGSPTRAASPTRLRCVVHPPALPRQPARAAWLTRLSCLANPPALVGRPSAACPQRGRPSSPSRRPQRTRRPSIDFRLSLRTRTRIHRNYIKYGGELRAAAAHARRMKRSRVTDNDRHAFRHGMAAHPTSVRPPVRSPALPVRPAVCPPARPSIHPPTRPPVHPSAIHPPARPPAIPPSAIVITSGDALHLTIHLNLDACACVEEPYTHI